MIGPRVQIFRTANGLVKAAWPRAPEHGNWLVRFLEGDLAGDRAFAETLLAQCAAVGAGNLPEYRASGNAFGITIGPEWVELAPHFAENSGPFRMRRTDLEKTIRRWLAAQG